MICEKCGIREANIQYIEVFNGTKTEHHLCAECAKNMGIDLMKPLSASFSGDEALSKILSGLLGIPNENQPKKEEEWDQVICPVCGTSYSEFVDRSRFGCPQCYDTFDLLMKENLKKIQDSDTHTGKHPRFGRVWAAPEGENVPEKKELTLEEQLDLLQEKLKNAIAEEEFEDAAQYRDAIRNVKERIKAEHEVV